MGDSPLKNRSHRQSSLQAGLRGHCLVGNATPYKEFGIIQEAKMCGESEALESFAGVPEDTEAARGRELVRS